jgi:hypothetical protein
MRHAALISLTLLLGLGACGKAETSLFADRSIPVLAPAASAETPARYIGRWAATPAQCSDAVVIEVRSLRDDGFTCEFDKVDQSSAGYTATSLCRMKGGPQPSRLTMIMPEPASLTLSGGPFKDGVALQRCAS